MALPSRRGEGEVTRRDPFAELTRLNQHLTDYLGGGWSPLSSVLEESSMPLADVEETDEAYIVEVELPGVKRDDINLEVAGRRLSVSGERKARERTGVLRRSTRTVGRFDYEVVLPGDVDEDSIEASLDEGVLTVRVPKAERDRPRRITVK